MYGQPLRLPKSRTAIPHGVHGATARVARTSGAHFKIRFYLCHIPNRSSTQFKFFLNATLSGESFTNANKSILDCS
jgi:hypothetical protein